MLKSVHLLLVTLVFISFISRIILAEFSAAYLQKKWLKIAPHVIDTLLLLSGIALVIQGNWLSSNYSWITGKLFLLSIYIALGMLAMRSQGLRRWTTATTAIICLTLIVKIAINKQILPI